MRNWLVFLITFSFVIKVVFAAGPSSMPKKWHHLNNLVEKEMKTIKARGKKIGPKLRYRLIELYSEKMKLIREKENKQFLNAKNNFREKVGKEYFYKTSKKYFNLAKSEGLTIVKRFPRFVYNGDIYYTLALNERDYNKEKDQKRFLKLALKYAEAGSPTIHKAKVALAEYYYNGKKYKTAIKYYNDVLKFKRDQWHSKHLYNSAWCHIKVNKNQKAIALLKQAFEYSKKARYINIDDQIYKSIGLFYVTAGEPSLAVDFYLKKSKTPHKHLLGLEKMTTNRGNIDQSKSILTTALSVAKKNKNVKQQAEVLHRRLKLFYQFKRSNNIFASANELLKIKKKHGLDVDIHNDSVEKIKAHVGFLQVSLTSNVDRFDQEQKDKKSKRILKFFSLLVQFNKINTDQYRFYQGETLYSISKYEEAAKLYIKALDFSKKYKKKDKKFKRKILNSLFSSLSIAEMTSNKLKKYNKYAYSNFLTIWPKDEKSPAIYKKLFNIYISEKNAEKATETFSNYNINYPKQLKIQRGMVTLVIEQYVKTKNFSKLSTWMIKLEKGFLGFDKKYVDNGLEILANMLFARYEKLVKKGKTAQAIAGYISIYENKKYPRIIHAQSAYNASLIYLERVEITKSLKWLTVSLSLFNKKEQLQLKDKIYAISENYYLLQDFKNASKLSSLMVNKLCNRENKTINNFYKNSVTFQLLEANPEESLTNYMTFKKCKINDVVKNETAQQMVHFYSNNRNLSQLVKLDKVLGSNEKLKNPIVKAMLSIFWDMKLNKSNASNERYVKSLLSKYQSSPQVNNDLKKEISNIKLFETYENQFSKTNLKIAQGKAKFSEENFNNVLQGRFSILEEFTKSGEDIIKVKHPILTLAVYKMLQIKYMEMTNSLKGYTPNQMPKEFVTGFKKQMGSVASQLQSKSNNYKNVAISTMKKNKIFNKFGKEISGAEVLDEYRYPASKLTLPLDFKN